VAVYQLTSEKKALYCQLLMQIQLLDQLQPDKVQDRMAAKMVYRELQETQKRLEATS
jgi:uncharacterized protein YeaC (DUF1315 family)